MYCILIYKLTFIFLPIAVIGKTEKIYTLNPTHNPKVVGSNPNLSTTQSP